MATKDNNQQAFDEYDKTIASQDTVGFARASTARSFQDIDGNTSVRSEYTYTDYSHYRSSEAISRDEKQLIQDCLNVYKRVSIVRSVIDMMSDFTVKGIRIVHKNKTVENFYRNWAKIVQFEQTSERLANMLYRTANCPVHIGYGKVPLKKKKEMVKSVSSIELKEPAIIKKEIPLRYSILNPLSLEVLGGRMSSFSGRPIYALKISIALKLEMDKLDKKHGNDPYADEIYKVIPEEIKEGIRKNSKFIPIDQKKLKVLFYKKDDWDVWATPMLASILKSINMLNKMHLADLSALDGAISQVRLWKLGDLSLNPPVLPTRSMLNRLRNELTKVGTGGAIDIVWGPDIDFKESQSNVHNYLKADKYQQVMSEIYAGLGVPASLTGGGSSGGNQGFTNNFISMRTLVERLEYGRKIILDFWEDQFKIIQKSMGFSSPAKVIFDCQVLQDENVLRSILIDLMDRNVISHEKVLEVYNWNSDVERYRINREEKLRDKNKMPEKASPYHNPQWDKDFKKALLDSGGVAPSEVGIYLDDKAEGDQTINERVPEMLQKYKPKDGQGRPQGANDKQKRKKKQVKVRTSAGIMDMFQWASKAQSDVSELLSPALLYAYGKKDVRSLTKAEFAEYEKIKFGVFASLEPYSDIDNETVYNILNNYRLDKNLVSIKSDLIQTFKERYNRIPTVDEEREIQVSAYCIYNEE